MTVTSFKDALKATPSYEDGKTSKKNYDDDRFWTPTEDDAGNGDFRIRFLPTPKGNTSPYVHYFRHSFFNFVDGQKRWYIEKSRTTLGKDFKDPVGVSNAELWKQGESGQNVARNRKRHKTYVANIYVVKDPSNPDNEGKVFLFRFGPQIMERLEAAENPQYEEDEKIEPFNPLGGGADFLLRFKKKDPAKDNSWRTYEDSKFASPAPVKIKGVGTSDPKEDKYISALKEIWESEYDLYEFVSPESFKSYDELEERLNWVLGLTSNAAVSAKDALNTSDDSDESPPWDTDDEETEDSPTEEIVVEDDDEDFDMDAFMKDLDD